ncbi:4'-phosphopantetheinyl transferase family protein [Pontibacter ruber]|uniref:Enterobactin synthase component D n=2 Tax=Pontibacter ruber TaxID=1343895 RepID=A0ABW5CXC5_9BACT
MPLFQTRQLDEHTLLGLWTLTEQAEELLHALPPHLDASEFIHAAHPKRQQEWLASRVLLYDLLRHFTDKPLALHRNATGKPFFPEAGLHVSITHSPEMAAVILSSKYEVGIDIELISPKALRVAGKFLSEQERGFTAGDEQQTCLYWSAKETLYKLYSKKRLLFKENLKLEPAATCTNLLQGLVQTDNFSKLYHVYFETIENHVLTYSIDNIID